MAFITSAFSALAASRRAHHRVHPACRRGTPLVCVRSVRTWPVCAAEPPSDAETGADDTLLRDASTFRARRAAAKASAGGTAGNDGNGLSVRSVLDTFLIGIFFLVVGLLVWLIVALVPHFASHNEVLLDPWLALWQPFIQPVLGVLMLGTIAQGAIGYFTPK